MVGSVIDVDLNEGNVINETEGVEGTRDSHAQSNPSS